MRKFFALTISMMLLVVCLTGPQVSAASRPEGWTEETHGKKFSGISRRQSKPYRYHHQSRKFMCLQR